MTFDLPTLDLSQPGSPLRISPTDVSQFIRLDQCERYLRLRLHERAVGLGFMRDYGVTPQSIPAPADRSGADFEARSRAGSSARTFRSTQFSSESRQKSGVARRQRRRGVGAWLAAGPGKTSSCSSPGSQVSLGGWAVRGDVDILRLERDAAGRLSAS